MGKLIVGCGYLGSRVANRWLAAGDDVWAVTRSDANARGLRARGLNPIVADITRLETIPSLSGFDIVLFAVGFDKSSGTSMREVYVDGVRNVLARLATGSPPSDSFRFLYISSTGVYGECDGGWVTEDSPCEPRREGGRVCWEAERVLAASPVHGRSIVLRLAGLYGPGRIPRGRELLAGQPISARAGAYMNLIHVDDATDVVMAAERNAAVPSLYIVSDGTPVRRADYYGELARLLRAPPPTLIERDASAPRAEREAGSKRLSNSKLMAELGMELRYPSYAEGLQAIVAEEEEARAIRDERNA